MTPLEHREVRCALCGHAQPLPVPPSGAGFGSADLDTRPPPPLRSGIDANVQRCARCGSCARDLAAPPPGVDRSALDDDHRALLDDTSLPVKSREFLCCARLQSAAGQWVEPFWATIEAAWVADDARQPEAAARCRGLALAALRMARAAGSSVGGQPGLDDAIEVDLLRRTGAFAEASRRIRAALARTPPEVIAQVLRLQQDLVDERDLDAHTVSEALR
jgi:hypothetical protein